MFPKYVSVEMDSIIYLFIFATVVSCDSAFVLEILN